MPKSIQIITTIFCLVCFSASSAIASPGGKIPPVQSPLQSQLVAKQDVTGFSDAVDANAPGERKTAQERIEQFGELLFSWENIEKAAVALIAKGKKGYTLSYHYGYQVNRAINDLGSYGVETTGTRFYSI